MWVWQMSRFVIDEVSTGTTPYSFSRIILVIDPAAITTGHWILDLHLFITFLSLGDSVSSGPKTSVDNKSAF